MGAQSGIPFVEGRTFLDYGEGFLFLRQKRVEYSYLIEFNEEGFATKQFLICIGTPSRTFMDTNNVMAAVKNGAFAFGLLHNHPNMTPPSKQDKVCNAYIRTIADEYHKLFLNHCVVGEKLYYMRSEQHDVFHEFRGRTAV